MIQMPDLSNPQQFMMADIVTKNSKTGFTSNKRLLVIKKKCLYYYSQIPKNFKNQPKFLESYHQLPKCSIDIVNIKKINGHEQGSNYFSIEFDARHMMETSDIRKTMTLQEYNFAPKNTKESITWQFSCTDQFIKQKWVNVLQKLKQQLGSGKKVNIEKYFQNINNRQEQKSSPLRSSMHLPWKQNQLKKSNSNESLSKSFLNQNSLSIRSPSKSKKSNSNDSNGQQRDNKRKPSKVKSQIQQEDLFQSFMKLEKTQSANQLSKLIKPEEEKQKKEKSEQNETIEQSIVNINTSSITNNGEKLDVMQQQKKQTNEEVLIEQTKKENPSSEFKEKEQENEKMEVPNELDQPQLIIKISQPEIREGEKKQNKSILIKKYKDITYNNSIRKKNFNSISQSRPKTYYKINTIQFKVDHQTSFYDLLFFAAHRHYSFQKRIEAQHKINSAIGNYTDKALKAFTDFVHSKGKDTQSSRYIQSQLQEGLTQLQIGYCKYRIGYVTTQVMSINGKQRVFYNQKTVKQLKKEMKIYNILFQKIFEATKNMENVKMQYTSELSISRTHFYDYQQVSEKVDNAKFNSTISLASLRVPLCTYIQYKGLCTLSLDMKNKEKQKDVSKQAKEQIRKLLTLLGYNFECFELKTVETDVGQYFILYLTSVENIEVKQKIHKNRNVTFEPPLNIDFLKKAKKDDVSMSIQSLLLYIRGIKSIKDTSKFICPREQILTTLYYCYICKYLRKFYRAGQGQISELRFINLFLSGDENIYKLFENSGFQLSQIQNKTCYGLLLEFIQYYLGIQCVVDHKKFQLTKILDRQKKGAQKIILQTKLIPRINGYQLHQTQLYESFNKLEYYINNNYNQLAQKCLQYKEATFFQNKFQASSYPWPAISQCLSSQAELNYFENDYITSITKCKQYLACVSGNIESEDQELTWVIPSPSCCIPVQIFMIKCYSKFSEQRFRQSLRDILQSIIFNFGEDSSILITVFQLVSLIYSNNSAFEQAQKFNRLAVSVFEKVLKNHDSTKLMYLYLDRSRILLQQKKLNESKSFYERALNLKSKQILLQQQLNFTLYRLEQLLQSPKSIQSQQKLYQIMHEGNFLIRSALDLSALIKQYYKLLYQLGLKYKKTEISSKAIEQLWKMDINSKVLAVEYSYRIVRRDVEMNKTQSSIEASSLSKEKCLLKLEENIKNYKGLLNLVSQTMIQQDNQIIPFLLKLLPGELAK